MAELARARFLGIPFVTESSLAVVDHIVERVLHPTGVGLPVHLIPVHGVSMTASDVEFLRVLNQPGVVIPDGKWLEILTRKNPQPLHQLRGTDLFEQVCEAGVVSGMRHFFIGSSDELLRKLERGLDARFPGISLAGSETYPFGELSNRERENLTSRIRASGAQVVWFGISTPRQNKEAIWLSEALALPVVCVGAALEFFAGSKKMAPVWMQRAGVEWLYRFASEPTRLWKRYVFGSLTFLRLYLTRRKSD